MLSHTFGRLNNTKVTNCTSFLIVWHLVSTSVIIIVTLSFNARFLYKVVRYLRLYCLYCCRHALLWNMGCFYRLCISNAKFINLVMIAMFSLIFMSSFSFITDFIVSFWVGHKSFVIRLVRYHLFIVMFWFIYRFDLRSFWLGVAFIVLVLKFVQLQQSMFIVYVRWGRCIIGVWRFVCLGFLVLFIGRVNIGWGNWSVKDRAFICTFCIGVSNRILGIGISIILCHGLIFSNAFVDRLIEELVY